MVEQVVAHERRIQRARLVTLFQGAAAGALVGLAVLTLLQIVGLPAQDTLKLPAFTFTALLAGAGWFWTSRRFD